MYMTLVQSAARRQPCWAGVHADGGNFCLMKTQITFNGGRLGLSSDLPCCKLPKQPSSARGEVSFWRGWGDNLDRTEPVEMTTSAKAWLLVELAAHLNRIWPPHIRFNFQTTPGRQLGSNKVHILSYEISNLLVCRTPSNLKSWRWEISIWPLV